MTEGKVCTVSSFTSHCRYSSRILSILILLLTDEEVPIRGGDGEFRWLGIQDFGLALRDPSVTGKDRQHTRRIGLICNKCLANLIFFSSIILHPVLTLSP